MVRWREGVKRGGETGRGRGVNKWVGEGKGVRRGGDGVTAFSLPPSPTRRPSSHLLPAGREHTGSLQARMEKMGPEGLSFS